MARGRGLGYGLMASFQSCPPSWASTPPSPSSAPQLCLPRTAPFAAEFGSPPPMLPGQCNSLLMRELAPQHQLYRCSIDATRLLQCYILLWIAPSEIPSRNVGRPLLDFSGNQKWPSSAFGGLSEACRDCTQPIQASEILPEQGSGCVLRSP